VDSANEIVIFDIHANISLRPICLPANMDIQAKYILRLLPRNVITNLLIAMNINHCFYLN